MKSLSIAVVFIGLVTADVAVAADKWPINFARKHVVGDSFRTTVRVTDTLKSNDELMRKISLSVTAIIKVTGITKRGGIGTADITIEQFAMTQMDKATTLPAGTKFTLSVVDQKAVVTDPTGKLDAGIMRGIKRAKPFRADTGSPGPQRLYGRTEPVAVGESWKTDPSVVVDFLAEKGIRIDKASVKGGATLNSAGKREGVAGTALNISTRLQATLTKIDKLPPSVKLETAHVGSKATGTISTDPRGPVSALDETKIITMTMQVTKDGKPVTVKSHGVHTRTIKNTRL